MNLGHPVLEAMAKSGCKNDKNIFMAFQTFMELSEVYKAQDIEFHYNPELDVIYLISLSCDEKEVFVPLSIEDSITPRWMKKFQTVFSRHIDRQEMHLAIRDEDTSNVTFKVTSGLKKPLSPQDTKEKKDCREKRELVEIEISNLLPTLIEQARKRELSLQKI